jgi:hypothetical protein
VTEFTIHIDSAEDLASDEGLTAMHESLTASHGAAGAAVGCDADNRYSATFQVDARDVAAAATIATVVFGEALAAAGHPNDAIAHLEVVAEAVAAA